MVNMVRPTAVVLANGLVARGGAERVAVTAAARLLEGGYEVALAYPGVPVDVEEVGDYFDVPAAGVGTLPLTHRGKGLAGREELRILGEQLAWARQIKAENPALLLNCQTGSEMPALADRSLYYVHFPHELGVGRAVGPRSLYLRGSRAARAWITNRGRPFLEGYTVLANSEFTAHHVQERWGRTAQVLYPPTPDFGPGAADRKRWILSVGRFQPRISGHPHKRQDSLIEAFRPLTRLHRAGWQLHLAGSVGSHDEVHRLKRLAEGLPVVFHENAPQKLLLDLYRHSSIYWHAQGFEEPKTRPEAQEHFGMSVAEALSAGLVPLVYETAGPAEIVAGLPGASTWRTLERLRAETMELIASDSLRMAALRSAAVQHSTRFTSHAFAERLGRVARGDADE